MNNAELPTTAGAPRWKIIVTVVVAVAGAAIIGGVFLSRFNAQYAAARRNVAMNRLRMIAMGIHNYEIADGQRGPPAAIYGRDGKPLLSWRVAVLPFLDEKALYDQFHLDEPWDSPHNAALINKMPDIFQPPSGEYQDNGKTSFVVPVAQKVAASGTEGRSSPEINRWGQKRVLIVEAARDGAVEWTKPADLLVDENDPWAGLRDTRGRGLVVAFTDGSTDEIPASTPNNTLNALLLIPGARPAGR